MRVQVASRLSVHVVCCIVLWEQMGLHIQHISSILLWDTELREECLKDLDQDERENNCITPSPPVYKATRLLLAGAIDPWLCQRAMEI